MADSIDSMGSNPLYFPLVPDWANPPTLNFGITRDYISFPGTVNILSATTELTPKRFDLSFLVTDKDSEYNLLEFLHNIKGRNKRFWIEYPIKQFQIKAAASSGASSLECEPNHFEKLVQGTERLFFIMNNGDLLVRKITEAAYSSDTDILSLTIATPIDRDIDVGDYLIFGRFLLVRLDEDTIKQEVITNDITAYSMRFSELSYEYNEEEAS